MTHPDADPSHLRRERAKAKAAFCLGTGVQPSEYDNLNQVEVDEFIKQQKRINDKANRKK